MSDHRNPRARVPKPPSTHNPRPDAYPPRALREMNAAFRAFVRYNPRAASATLDVLEIVSQGNRRRSMALVEAASALVASIRGRS